MKKVILVNATESEECRVAVLEDGILEELYLERADQEALAGNIYKARVVNVEPSLQAAFVDFGTGKHGFLHASDITGRAGGKGGRGRGNRDKGPSIQGALKRNQELVVQVVKEGIAEKCPSVTTRLSIPGRYLVIVPGGDRAGVSRRIEDEEERRKLKAFLQELKPPKDMGFIIRTAGLEKSKEDLKKDLDYMLRLWKTVERQMKSAKVGDVLYRESDLVTRTVRDVLTDDVSEIIIDSAEVCRKVKEFLRTVMPRRQGLVKIYRGTVPLFHRFGIEGEVGKVYARKVPLPSGGGIVIDPTEALVAIDVNSGKYTDESTAEETAFRTNLEACREVSRQLRMRDLGGVIIVDFIDMRHTEHILKVEETFDQLLRRDRAKISVSRISRFGIMEMTRQRIRPSVEGRAYETCAACGGRGRVKTVTSLGVEIVRHLRNALHREDLRRIDLLVHPSLSLALGRRRAELEGLEAGHQKRIAVGADPGLGQDQYRLTGGTAGGKTVNLLEETVSAPRAIEPAGDSVKERSNEHVRGDRGIRETVPGEGGGAHPGPRRRSRRRRRRSTRQGPSVLGQGGAARGDALSGRGVGGGQGRRGAAPSPGDGHEVPPAQKFPGQEGVSSAGV
ncbi:MAG: Rne/Rng family ribonuclease [Planctomycetota bacterium]